MVREITRRANLLSVFIFLLLLPMAVGYFMVTAIEFVLTKIFKALC